MSARLAPHELAELPTSAGKTPMVSQYVEAAIEVGESMTEIDAERARLGGMFGTSAAG